MNPDNLRGFDLPELRALAIAEFGFDRTDGVYFPDAPETAFQVKLLEALWLAMWEATSPAGPDHAFEGLTPSEPCAHPGCGKRDATHRHSPPEAQ